MFEILSICKGGGYQYCRTNPAHPKRNSKGLYPLHRVLMENKIGRLLTTEEHVHHKDENKWNDTIENLEILSVSEHALLHAKRKENLVCDCTYCGKEISLKPHLFRLRTNNSVNGICCSRKCSVSLQHKLKQL